MKYAFLFLVFVLAMVPVTVTMEKRDARLMQTANLYERCVIAEYRMTPIKYYEENHKYPICGN